MAETQMQVLVTRYSYFYKFHILILSPTFMSIECLLCLFYFLSGDRIDGDGICLLALTGYCGLCLMNIVLKKITAALTEQKLICMLLLK